MGHRDDRAAIPRPPRPIGPLASALFRIRRQLPSNVESVINATYRPTPAIKGWSEPDMLHRHATGRPVEDRMTAALRDFAGGRHARRIDDDRNARTPLPSPSRRLRGIDVRPEIGGRVAGYPRGNRRNRKVTRQGARLVSTPPFIGPLDQQRHHDQQHCEEQPHKGQHAISKAPSRTPHIAPAPPPSYASEPLDHYRSSGRKRLLRLHARLCSLPL